MTPAQTMLYFREWGAVRKHYTGQGIDPKQADAKRHELHRRALGVMKSSKDFTNADLDKVLGVFRAITQPGNLEAQLRQLDQAEKRFSALLDRARDLASRCVSKPGLEGRYLDGMALKIFGPAQYHLLNETQLGQLCGILQRRIDQIMKKAGEHYTQPVGAHKTAAQDKDDVNPF